MSRALRIAIASVLAVASLAYMWLSLGSMDSLGAVAWLGHPWLVASSVAMNAVALSLGCLLWWWALERIAPGTVSPGHHWRIWAISSPARYVPGRIWHTTSLGLLLRSTGVPVSATVTSIAVHMWLTVLASCVVGLGLLPSTPLSTTARIAIAVVVVSVAVGGTHPRLLGAAIGLAARVARQPLLGWRATWGHTLALGGWNVVLQVVGGVASCVMLNATMGLAIADVPRVISANAVAFVAGYVSLVPAGLGVKDSALALLLAPVASVGHATAAAIALRAWSIASEVLLLLIALATYRRREARTRTHPPRRPT